MTTTETIPAYRSGSFIGRTVTVPLGGEHSSTGVLRSTDRDTSGGCNWVVLDLDTDRVRTFSHSDVHVHPAATPAAAVRG